MSITIQVTEAEKRNTLIGQSKSRARRWRIVDPSTGLRAAKGRLSRGKPKSSYHRKCFSSKRNNTCPPQKRPGKYLFIDVLIRKPGISEMMINIM